MERQQRTLTEKLIKIFRGSMKRECWNRDKLIHQYFGVNLNLVWETVKRDLLRLKEQISKY